MANLGDDLLHLLGKQYEDVKGDVAKFVEDNNLKLRVWYPDTCGTCDWLPERVNAVVNVHGELERLYLG